MANVTNVPAPRVPFLDERTGLISREWFRFLQNLYTQTGGDATTTSIQDVELTAGAGSADTLAEIQKSLQDLEVSILPPPPASSSGGGTTAVFTSTTNGLAPASGGGSTNYLRADGSWAVPPGTGGGVTDGDKGDITVSGGATVWTIDSGVVTNAKMANVSTSTFKGRTTAGTGSPEDLTGTQATALLNTFSSTLKGLTPASGGGTTNFLRADGTWAAAGGGGTAGNPTASVGLTAVNGTASTYMRSDAAPPLDVSISPTWSGSHTFSQKVTSTASTTGSAATGAYTYGALGYSDQNNLLTLQSDVNAYNQLVLQNTSALSAASADLTISNNNGTASTFYGNFGMNSSGWAGTAGTASFSAPNIVYLTATSGDLALGTTTSNPIRFVVNSGADAGIIDTSNRFGIGVASPTAMLHLKAGTATANTAPLKFTSGTSLTSAEAGAMEYDGTAAYITQQTTTGRGIVLAPQVVRLNATRSKANNTVALEAVFDTANDVINLTASTLYYFRGVYLITTAASATAAGVQMGFLFSSAQQSIGYRILSHVTASATAQTTQYVTVATATTVTATATTSAAYCVQFEGWFKSNATTGGTLTPAFTQSVVGTAATVSALSDTWLMLMPMSNNTSATVIAGAWA